MKIFACYIYNKNYSKMTIEIIHQFGGTLMPLQKILVQFEAPTWYLKITCNSSS